MTQLHNTGEEFVLRNDLDGQTLDVGLYNSSDALNDSDNVSDITTEPDDTQDYARQTQTFNVVFDIDNSGDWGIETNTVEFEVSDNTESIDKYFVLTGDGDLLFTGDLEDSRDLTDIDILEVETVAGTLT